MRFKLLLVLCFVSSFTYGSESKSLTDFLFKRAMNSHVHQLETRDILDSFLRDNGSAFEYKEKKYGETRAFEKIDEARDLSYDYAREAIGLIFPGEEEIYGVNQFSQPCTFSLKDFRLRTKAEHKGKIKDYSEEAVLNWSSDGYYHKLFVKATGEGLSLFSRNEWWLMPIRFLVQGSAGHQSFTLTVEEEQVKIEMFGVWKALYPKHIFDRNGFDEKKFKCTFKKER